MDLDYTHRSVNGMWMHGVGTGWILETAYIKKRIQVASDMRYGHTPMDLHAGYNTMALLPLMLISLKKRSDLTAGKAQRMYI